MSVEARRRLRDTGQRNWLAADMIEPIWRYVIAVASIVAYLAYLAFLASAEGAGANYLCDSQTWNPMKATLRVEGGIPIAKVKVRFSEQVDLKDVDLFVDKTTIKGDNHVMYGGKCHRGNCQWEIPFTLSFCPCSTELKVRLNGEEYAQYEMDPAEVRKILLDNPDYLPQAPSHVEMYSSNAFASYPPQSPQHLLNPQGHQEYVFSSGCCADRYECYAADKFQTWTGKVDGNICTLSPMTSRPITVTVFSYLDDKKSLSSPPGRFNPLLVEDDESEEIHRGQLLWEKIKEDRKLFVFCEYAANKVKAENPTIGTVVDLEQLELQWNPSELIKKKAELDIIQVSLEIKAGDGEYQTIEGERRGQNRRVIPVSPCIKHEVRVVATDLEGRLIRSPFTVTVDQPTPEKIKNSKFKPKAPRNLVVNHLGDGKVMLSWDATECTLRYEVQISAPTIAPTTDSTDGETSIILDTQSCVENYKVAVQAIAGEYAVTGTFVTFNAWPTKAAAETLEVSAQHDSGPNVTSVNVELTTGPALSCVKDFSVELCKQGECWPREHKEVDAGGLGFTLNAKLEEGSEYQVTVKPIYQDLDLPLKKATFQVPSSSKTQVAVIISTLGVVGALIMVSWLLGKKFYPQGLEINRNHVLPKHQAPDQEPPLLQHVHSTSLQ